MLDIYKNKQKKHIILCVFFAFYEIKWYIWGNSQMFL